LVGIELLAVEARIVAASVETYLKSAEDKVLTGKASLEKKLSIFFALNPSMIRFQKA
jgi:hypothetical protein